MNANQKARAKTQQRGRDPVDGTHGMTRAQKLKWQELNRTYEDARRSEPTFYSCLEKLRDSITVTR